MNFLKSRTILPMENDICLTFALRCVRQVLICPLDLILYLLLLVTWQGPGMERSVPVLVVKLQRNFGSFVAMFPTKLPNRTAFPWKIKYTLHFSTFQSCKEHLPISGPVLLTLVCVSYWYVSSLRGAHRKQTLAGFSFSRRTVSVVCFFLKGKFVCLIPCLTTFI